MQRLTRLTACVGVDALKYNVIKAIAVMLCWCFVVIVNLWYECFLGCCLRMVLNVFTVMTETALVINDFRSLIRFDLACVNANKVVFLWLREITGIVKTG